MSDSFLKTACYQLRGLLACGPVRGAHEGRGSAIACLRSAKQTQGPDLRAFPRFGRAVTTVQSDARWVTWGKGANMVGRMWTYLWWTSTLLIALGCGERSGGRNMVLDPGEAFSDPQVVALALAAQNGDVEEIDRLVTVGVDVNTIGRQGVSPLYWALLAQNKRGFKRLLEHGASPNIQTDDGDSVMHLGAELADDPEWIELALEHGGDPNLVASKNRYRWKWTPIYCAINAEHARAVELLIEAGADLDHRNWEDETPLEFAAWCGRSFDIVYLLLRAGSDYRKKTHGGMDIATRIFEAELLPGDSPYWLEKCRQFIREDMAKSEVPSGSHE